MPKNRSGFTLIELLIVVAIIAILAAIAIPNFLAAQVRSKVSRAAADMRSISVAVESYYVDNTAYPFPTNLNLGQIFSFDGNGYTFEGVPMELSTPVAYITSSVIKDPFSGKDAYINGLHSYHFRDNDEIAFRGFGNNVVGGYLYYQLYGQTNYNEQWVLWSHGPDLLDNFAQGVLYDPTNGTVSNGDVVRFGP